MVEPWVEAWARHAAHIPAGRGERRAWRERQESVRSREDMGSKGHAAVQDMEAPFPLPNCVLFALNLSCAAFSSFFPVHVSCLFGTFVTFIIAFFSFLFHWLFFRINFFFFELFIYSIRLFLFCHCYCFFFFCTARSSLLHCFFFLGLLHSFCLFFYGIPLFFISWYFLVLRSTPYCCPHAIPLLCWCLFVCPISLHLSSILLWHLEFPFIIFASFSFKFYPCNSKRHPFLLSISIPSFHLISFLHSILYSLPLVSYRST